MSYTYINVYTSTPLKQKLEFENLPEGSVFIGIKIENEFLNHEIRCRLENLTETKLIICNTLEQYLSNGLIENYKVV